MCFLCRTRTKNNEIKEDTNMNMLRHIFSFKLVIVFALVGFIGVVRGEHRNLEFRFPVPCPCPFTLLYKASIAQASSIGLPNKVDLCIEFPGEELQLRGGSIDGPCLTVMVIFLDDQVCDYHFDCQGGYAYDTFGISLSGA